MTLFLFFFVRNPGLSVFKGGNISGLTEELQKQIAQKDAVIKKLEFEKSEILERLNILAESFDELTEDFNELTDNFNELTRNFNQKEYQLEVVTIEKIDLDNRVKELEADVKALEGEQSLLIQKLRDKKSKISELQQDLSLMSQYADDLEQYAEDLEQYYLEQLETYSDSSNINELEELQKQIDEKDDDIRKLTSHINLILEDEYLKDLQQEISEKDACIRNLKSHISLLLENQSLNELEQHLNKIYDYFYEEYIYIYTTPLRSEIFIGMDIDTMNFFRHRLYEEPCKVKHLLGMTRKINTLMRYR
ncbi:MAG: hypothetical protein ACKPE3_33560 [Sphaerospermopsis kisseleviana]